MPISNTSDYVPPELAQSDPLLFQLIVLAMVGLAALILLVTE